MKRFSYPLVCLGTALCALVFSGCPSGGASLGTEYVEGVVTLDGNPIADATVMFVPVTEGEGLSATGQTDASGVYKLTAANMGGETAAAGGGTLPGEYFVGVIKSVSEEPMSEEEAFEKGIPYTAPDPNVAPKLVHEVPTKYNNPRESGLKVTVKAGKNDIPLQLSATAE